MDNMEELKNNIISRYDLEDLRKMQIRTKEEIDSEWARISRIEDPEERQRQQEYLSKNFITQEEYDELEKEFIQGDRAEENKEELANNYKSKLNILKQYYDKIVANNSDTSRNVMSNYNVDSMSNEEIIEFYESIRRELGYDYFEKIENELKDNGLLEEEEEEKTTNVVRVKKSKKASSELRDKISKLDIDMALERTQIETVLASLTLDTNVNEEVTDMMKEIDSSFEEIRKDADLVVKEIDEFRSEFEYIDKDTISREKVQEIFNKVTKIRYDIKNLKRMHVERYNAKVDSINKEIEEINKIDTNDPEILSLRGGLKEATRCDRDIRSYKDKYYDQINYNELIELSRLVNIIKDIKNRVNNEQLVVKNNVEEECLSEIKYLEDSLNQIDMELYSIKDINNEDRIEYEEALLTANNMIDALTTRIVENQDKISGELLSDIYELKIRLDNIKDRLNNRTLEEVINVKNSYEELKYRIEQFEKEIDFRIVEISSVIDKINDETKELLENNIIRDKDKIEEFNKQLKKLVEDGLLDEVQYNNIANRLKILEAKNKLMSSYIDRSRAIYNIYDYLNGKIDGIESAINQLDKLVQEQNGIIKDKEVRIQIDNAIKKIYEEIDKIQKMLDENEDKDNSKNEELNNRLENARNRLDAINKVYKSKRPLRVKIVKSVKEFYKKHKKICLIAIGLATIAILHATVGPVIIPAIMHGNMMIGWTAPKIAFRMTSINKILGGLINATVIDETWFLANGVAINPYIASTSLLKGLSISGIGSSLLLAPFFAPIIVRIKELIKKMKLKDKLKKEQEKVAKKAKEVRDNANEKVKKVVNKGKEVIKDTGKKLKHKNDVNKENEDTNSLELMHEKKKTKKNTVKKNNGTKASKEVLSKINDLLKKYVKSEVSFDEFCRANDLSEEDIELLEPVVKSYENGRNGRGK